VNIPDLDPTWPSGTQAWLAFALILGMGLFKLDRGLLMKRRAAYVDRFGASVITFDLVFGATLLVSTVTVLFPRLRTFDVIFWLTIAPLFVVMAWQWVEIRLASRDRVHVAMAGTISAAPWSEGDPDRRLEFRRVEDRELRGIT
jgi:hypothetical protein